MTPDEITNIADLLEAEGGWKDLLSSADPDVRHDPKSALNQPMDWFSIGKQAGKSGVDSKTVIAAVEGFYRIFSYVDKVKREKAKAEAQRQKERWTRINPQFILGKEHIEVQRLREEANPKNAKSAISKLLSEVASLKVQLQASDSRLEAVGREIAAATIKGKAATANADYLKRLKRVICVTAAGDAAITIFLTSDFLVVGSFDTLVDAYNKGNFAELIIRLTGLILLSFVPYVMSIAVKSMADHDRSGAVRRRIEWTSVVLGGLFFGGAALGYFFDALSRPPLGWSIFTALSTLCSTLSILGLTTGLVVVGGLAAHYYFIGTQQSKIAEAESAANRQRLLEYREQIAAKQTEMQQRRVELTREIQQKRADFADAARKLADARASLETQRASARATAAVFQPAADIESVKKGAAAMALLGWQVGAHSIQQDSNDDELEDLEHKRDIIERKLAGRNGHSRNGHKRT